MVSRKKVAVLLDFLQITSTPPPPPPPNLDNLYRFFCTPMCQKLRRGLLLLPHPKIDPTYSVREKWTKSKRTATFFGRPSLTERVFHVLYIPATSSSFFRLAGNGTGVSDRGIGDLLATTAKLRALPLLPR